MSTITIILFVYLFLLEHNVTGKNSKDHNTNMGLCMAMKVLIMNILSH